MVDCFLAQEFALAHRLLGSAAMLERKIDAAVTLMMALGQAMAEGDGGTLDLDAFLADPVSA